MISDALSSSVLSHWYTLIPNFQASAKDFYASVETAIGTRQIPNCELSRVDYLEAGVFSAQREYLRVSRGRLVFDVCAAPFGNGFFFSWWLSRPESSHGALALLLLILGLVIAMIVAMSQSGFLWGLLFTFIGIPGLFWLFVAFMRNNATEGWDDPLVAMPYLGPFYERLFRPQTYYKTDTALMFQESVRAAVREAIDGMTSAKGVRGLTDLEYKPILRRI